MAAVDDNNISVRFKHGIHTIYLFVDAQAPFSALTDALLEVLRERYPSGLTTSVTAPTQTQILPGTRLAYGVLKIASDPSRGWKKLNIGEAEELTPIKFGLRANSIVAFKPATDNDKEGLFEVVWPQEDDDYEQGD